MSSFIGGVSGNDKVMMRSPPPSPPLRFFATNDYENKVRCARSKLPISRGDADTTEDGATNKISNRPTSFSATPWENPKSLVGSLLERTTSRAMRTLSTNADFASVGEEENDSSNPTIGTVLDATIVRASSTLDGRNSDNDNDADRDPTIKTALNATVVRASSILDGRNIESNNDSQLESPAPAPPKQHQDKRTYLGNPSVTPTALAHSLWRSTILPYQDTVIDATCGNGKDCLALARMLFPGSIGEDSNIAACQATSRPELIGIDIQSRAIHNTKRSLLSSLPSDIYYNHVTLLEQSHERLMDVPSDAGSVGLVCYNLGYLPGAPSQERPDIPSNYKECQTQTETTLNSITDASLLLRVGGLLSVLTYPGSNLEESTVVERFVEGLAMLTTRDAGGWRGYVQGIPDDDEDGRRGDRVRALVTKALERVVAQGARGQTWRTFVHKPLGRPLSPVLVTAMRIK
eukprot:CAMPEP_0172569494 /NCGR_PEP_ID=MMETSP1067-20121228/123721_1 /TAXON_ID=265564 ORGANISM="Thalassiosira punctigera, Strain Tpunct2005C2" /NCGR_SAMPLE_ID=MMETSP1067 /ASSEMBLY_ACC=CAM_ASM_000444 /LENGTH=461 /DNA_ID=CAMNT_0013361327 /DNA_START=101 /DNA_END=1486 /DNA_ORIENTATION=-